LPERIYPVPVKPPTNIKSWGGWPDDVRPILWKWNHGHPGESRLRFTNNGFDVFKCPDCQEFCKQPLGAELDGDFICDDCLIGRARAAIYEADMRRAAEVERARACCCSPGVTSIECPIHGGAL
jgi:hypothetical protein